GRGVPLISGYAGCVTLGSATVTPVVSVTPDPGPGNPQVHLGGADGFGDHTPLRRPLMDLTNPRGYEARMIATLLAHARLWLDIGDRAKALELINEAQ